MLPQPLNNNVLIEPRVESEKRGSLFVPGGPKVSGHVGTVLAVAPEVDIVSPGDVVHFAPFSGDEFHLDGKDMRIVSQDLILAVET